ncbi:MAG: transposase [DPANN group archaeon]|nr:transposase [DPANN group archaeon]
MVLDRGFFSDEIMTFLETIQMSYVLPVRRNSKYYENRIHCNNHLIYHKRLIRSGKRKLDKSVAYVFEDMDLKLEEQKTLYMKLEDGKITKKQIDEKMKRTGIILILSNLDIEPKEIFYLFKKRENIEKMFDTYKTVLNADKLYLQDDESVFGHIFIAFLSLYIHCAIEKMLKTAKLNHKITPIDLLQKFGKVYNLKIEDKNIITEVPKKVKELDELLGLNIFPKVQS